MILDGAVNIAPASGELSRPLIFWIAGLVKQPAVKDPRRLDMKIHCDPGALYRVPANLLIPSVSCNGDDPGGEINLDISAAEEEIIVICANNKQDI